MFLGIYRGTCSSEYTEGPVPRNVPRDMFLGTCPSVYSEEDFPRKYPDEVLRRYIPRRFPTN
uniref:Uncharacterized protein n=1 Tax=Brassica oleracea TaxID=3712 RepID=A0A3P6CWR7_BRAOL|nr:unnamed protein product [Brassica oleracea]